MRRMATIDDDEMAAPFLVELKALGEQHKQPQQEHDELLAERTRWELAQARLDDLQWCCTRAERLASLTYDQKRLALVALRVEARVWSKDHDPRIAVPMHDDLDTPLSDPHSAADDDLFAEHVGASIRHGYARRGARRADRP
ncbi:MAG: hypothetical protein KY456_12320 [Chloroflexi bacterium]|nr:hypothetical protein [Chloroflexota bacterium]